MNDKSQVTRNNTERLGFSFVVQNGNMSKESCGRDTTPPVQYSHQEAEPGFCVIFVTCDLLFIYGMGAFQLLVGYTMRMA